MSIDRGFGFTQMLRDRTLAERSVATTVIASIFGSLATGGPRTHSPSFPEVLWDDLDDAHHPLVLMIDRVTVVNETPNDHRIGKGNDQLQYARRTIGRRQH